MKSNKALPRYWQFSVAHFHFISYNLLTIPTGKLIYTSNTIFLLKHLECITSFIQSTYNYLIWLIHCPIPQAQLSTTPSHYPNCLLSATQHAIIKSICNLCAEIGLILTFLQLSDRIIGIIGLLVSMVTCFILGGFKQNSGCYCIPWKVIKNYIKCIFTATGILYSNIYCIKRKKSGPVLKTAFKGSE